MLRWPINLSLLVLTIAVLLDHAPRRRQPSLTWLALGAGIAAVVSALATLGLALYVSLSGSFGSVYGPLAGIFALLLWALLSSVALFLGTAVCAQLEALRAGSGDPALPDPGRPTPAWSMTPPATTERMTALTTHYRRPMPDIVICEPLRTPVGRYGGSLAPLSAVDLASQTLAELVRRTGLTEGDVDDVILGNCYPSGENPAIGRIAALDAGLGTGVPGLQLDRRCGSGLQAVLYAAAQIASGGGAVIVAGGVESMSNVEHYALGLRTGVRSGGVELMDRLVRARETAGGKDHPVPGGMLETAENLRREYSVSREEQDELAVRSQQRAAAAHDAGRFASELVPITVPGRRGKPDVVVDRDEHPRPDTTLEQLAALRPVREKVDPGSTVTAGNASGQNDGAAMCVVTTRADAERLGLRPLLSLKSWAVAGVGPEVMGIGPVPATAAALDRAELTLDEIDLIELNEAFAAQVLACLREWGLDAHDERLNPNGSGISLGHPVGATGARILATLGHEMHRREARYGLETMCIGGGQGLAAIFERVG
ncbi:MAG: acetyl-CoA acetyltransferase [Nocardioides sp.]|uniref:acetyl-CoA C-acetyltransferase n=1 Tax=Nocardioides sp. TaxID=35761 RepID=UPI002635A5DF|nr:acetyl-CoA C-acetyltransferase [Nocardioides sp.]MCW2832226.1 acetyl-CoA acetyltransferase [Nocardioides sp.]